LRLSGHKASFSGPLKLLIPPPITETATSTHQEAGFSTLIKLEVMPEVIG
jgi:hypothetical protein